ncbi:MAG: FlgD immunoglobulin-like domain containing protein, partial [bacterium]
LLAFDGAGPSGTSDTLSVLPAAFSPVLNMTHRSPDISNVVMGQSVEIFDFTLNIPVGQKPIQLTGLDLRAEDQAGNGVPLDSAFQSLTLSYPGVVLPTSVVGNGDSSITLAGPVSVVAGTSLAVTLTARGAPDATAKTVRLLTEGGTLTEQGASAGAVTFSTIGDSTGFPMTSNLLVLSNGDLAKTYGNHPNPFHAGSESTQIEFYLSQPSKVSLELYDVMGNRVDSLLKGVVLPEGTQRVSWDGRNGRGSLVLSGIYFARLDVNGTQLLLKIAVVK